MTKPASTINSLRGFTDAKAEGFKKADTFRIDPNLITFEEGFNLRQGGKEVEDHIDRLYHAMLAGAFIPPVDVSVSEGKVIARDGHCRTVAAQRVRKKMPDYTLECRQLRGNDSDAILHMLGTGTGGLKLTPLESGLGYLRLINMGLKNSEIAEKLGVSRVTIDNGLTLAEAPREVQKWIVDGKVSATTARKAMESGKDGIAALKEQVAKLDAEPETPAKPNKKGKTKPAKKKKVTAKKLKGTAAEKKTTKKKKAEAGTDTPELPLDGDSSIRVTIPRDVATESVAKIKAAATASPELRQLAAILEAGLI
jgi:ParB family transcriptional regulator, chromosome partitioning protein